MTRPYLLAAALLLASMSMHAAPADRWVALDPSVRAALPGWGIRPLELPQPGHQVQQHGFRLARMSDEQLARLSEHLKESGRHGGFTVHASREAAEASLDTIRHSRYAIEHADIVRPMLASIDEQQLIDTITRLSSWPDRRHRSEHGVRASTDILELWSTLADARADLAVEQVAHTSTPQRSVVLTWKGRSRPDEIIVLGGHMDSASSQAQAPGADDDASGIACLTDILRVLLQHDYQPERTLKFIAYAGEEAGLLGSDEIARDYRERGQDVLGVLQLDMTNYKGSADDIYLITDATNRSQNDFLRQLVTTYQPGITVNEDVCGYGCSDHASWHRQGYAASFPFEADFAGTNPFIHTDRDTLEVSDGRASHSVKFARLGLSYAVELASQTGSVTVVSLP